MSSSRNHNREISSPSGDFQKMEQVVELMKKPAPKHVMEGLCQRLKEIETNEKGQQHFVNGAVLADECRKYIYSQDEILWMHVLMTAYYINGGVMLREAHSLPDMQSSSNCSKKAAIEAAQPEQKTQEGKSSSNEKTTTPSSVAHLVAPTAAPGKKVKSALDLVQIPGMDEMEEMIRHMNM